MNWTALRERLLGENIQQIRPPKLAIPALPAVAMEFCRAADNPNISIHELSNILDRDPAIVVDLLKNVNSSSTGKRNRISSSRAALALLGARRAKMFVLTSSIQTVSQKTSSKFATVKAFSFAAMQRAVFARRLADRLGFDADLCFAAGLLQDFTVPALTTERSDRYRAILESLTDDVPSIAVLEQARFGWDHAVAGARLMLSWQFPDDLISLLLTHHWLSPILASPTFSQCEMVVVALSSLLPDALDARPFRTALLDHLLTTRYQIDTNSFREWVSQDVENAGFTVEPLLAWKVDATPVASSSAGERQAVVSSR